MERNKEFLRLIHTPTQTSEPIARALKEHNLTIPGISLYEENYTEDEIIDRKTGLQKRIRPYDVVHGKLTNGLKSISKTSNTCSSPTASWRRCPTSWQTSSR